MDHVEDRRTALASVGLGGLLLVAAVVAVVQALSVRSIGSSFILGPGAFPLLIGVLLAAVGAALVVRSVLTLRSEGAAGRVAGGADVAVDSAEPGAAATESPSRVSRLGWPARIGLLLGVLIVFALLLPYAGYVVSSTLLFAGTALLLGAPHKWRTLAAGWTLAAVAFLAFDRLIGLTLPTGPWGF